jgi:hypothetical protein
MCIGVHMMVQPVIVIPKSRYALDNFRSQWKDYGVVHGPLYNELEEPRVTEREVEHTTENHPAFKLIRGYNPDEEDSVDSPVYSPMENQEEEVNMYCHTDDTTGTNDTLDSDRRDVGTNMARGAYNPEYWLFDTGATVHVTPTDTFLTNIVYRPQTIKVAEGTRVHSPKYGDLTLRSECGGTIHLLKVLYVPEFYKNIISGYKLLQNETYKLVVSHTQASLINTETYNKIHMPLQCNPKPLWYLHAHRVEPSTSKLEFNKTTYPDHSKDISDDFKEVLNLKLMNTISNHKSQVKRLQAPNDTTQRLKVPSMDINVAHARMAHANEVVLRKTLMKAGILATGTLQSCAPCNLYKAKAKTVPKSATKAQFRGQRIHMDLSGPYNTTVTGDTYWVKFKDHYSKMSWNVFCKSKAMVPSILDQKLKQFTALDIHVINLRCDNAGEHGDKLRKVCESYGVKIEYTAPYTPQQNGIVERQFYTDITRANSMLEAAHFKPETKRWLLFEAIKVATTTYNICSTFTSHKSPYELFYEVEPPITPYHMVEFGRVGYVTIRNKFSDKTKMKAEKCVFVGYADHHSPDTYRMYKPSTRSIILSRDVRWADWTSYNPKSSLPLYQGPTFDSVQYQTVARTPLKDPTNMDFGSGRKYVSTNQPTNQYNTDNQTTNASFKNDNQRTTRLQQSQQSLQQSQRSLQNSQANIPRKKKQIQQPKATKMRAIMEQGGGKLKQGGSNPNQGEKSTRMVMKTNQYQKKEGTQLEQQ